MSQAPANSWSDPAARVAESHSGMSIGRFFALHHIGVACPVLAGLLLYGWRALVVMGLVVGASLAALTVWRSIGRRGCQMRPAQVLWMALLLALMLPAHWATVEPPFAHTPGNLWAAALAAGGLLVMVTWLLGGAGLSGVHPVLVTYLLLVVAMAGALAPHWVLQRNHLVLGDLAKAAPMAAYPREGWLGMRPVSGRDALEMEPASQRLGQYTQVARGGGPNISLEALVRDEMPPLEDLVVGGHPGPIGTGCAAAVIVGGLFLLYRGVIDAQIPLLMCAAAVAAFLILPLPLIAGDGGVHWRWLALRVPGIAPATDVTFACYELLAGPILFSAFFLATSPSLRPMRRGGRAAYAILAGSLAAGFQLWISVAWGPYLALLAVGFTGPMVDWTLCRCGAARGI